MNWRVISKYLVEVGIGQNVNHCQWFKGYKTVRIERSKVILV